MNNVIERFDKLPDLSIRGAQRLWSLSARITAEKDSFLHVGGAGTPLSDVKMQIFKVQGTPVVPATSFKGALRHQLDRLLIAHKTDYAQHLGASADFFRPCVPSADPSYAEKEALKEEYRVTIEKRTPQHCSVQIDQEKLSANKDSICPSCYFLGAAGFPGFARISNFLPDAKTSETVIIQQARLRRDQKTGTAAPGAIVTAEQVPPGIPFLGSIEILEETTGFKFGECRTFGDKRLDPWLAGTVLNLDQRRLFLFNDVLLPALRNITELGGMKSGGAGKVRVEVFSP